MNDLTGIMERATENLRPDVTALVAGGVTRGRRLRNRRRMAGGVGALAAVASVGAGLLLVPSFVAGTQAPAGSAASSPAAAPARQLPTRAALAGGEVVRLPAGTSTVTQSWGGPSQGYVGAAWSYAPASGGAAARVDVLVQKFDLPLKATGAAVPVNPESSSGSHLKVEQGKRMPANPSERLPYSPENACHLEPGTCSELADGSWVSSFTLAEPLSGGGASDIIGAHATIYTLDGFTITATAYNALSEKHVDPTRTAPVLNEAQLTALLRSAHLG